MMSEEKAQSLKASEYWEWIVDELKYRITLEMAKLRKVSANRLSEQQARIQVLEEFTTLPDDVLDREAAPTVPDQPQVAR